MHINDASGEIVDNTGIYDVTTEFQQAINKISDLGGGSIYVPEGTYRFDGTLTIHEGVYLRGDFSVPDSTNVSGTILEVYSGRGTNQKPETSNYTLDNAKA